MKKKQLSPVLFLAFILFLCMLLTVISNHVGETKTSQVTEESESGLGDMQTDSNDLMIWESVSHHLLSVTR